MTLITYLLFLCGEPPAYLPKLISITDHSLNLTGIGALILLIFLINISFLSTR